MTEVEYRLKYPIGTKIRYAPNVDDVYWEARKDIGKQGMVIGHLQHQVKIHLPMSEKPSKTWKTLWKNVKRLPQKNEQLLFDFAY